MNPTRNVVMHTSLSGSDLRPPTLLSDFHQASVEEAKSRFAGPEKVVAVDCPACSSADQRAAFTKNGFRYVECGCCGSLYVSPRPRKSALEEYYTTSEAAQLRVRYFTRDAAEARRIHVHNVRAAWVAQTLDDLGGPKTATYLDVGTICPQLIKAVASLGWFQTLLSFEPFPALPRDTLLTADVVVTESPTGVAAATAFEWLEHQFSPFSLLCRIREALVEGGALFITLRGISGFDLQVLWDAAEYIFVPEHLNLLSVEGARILLERAGYEIVELSTPGQLDLELIQQVCKENRDVRLPRFLEYLFAKRGEAALRDFQEFLQKHTLSSHIRVAAIKKGDAE